MKSVVLSLILILIFSCSTHSFMNNDVSEEFFITSEEVPTLTPAAEITSEKDVSIEEKSVQEEDLEIKDFADADSTDIQSAEQTAAVYTEDNAFSTEEIETLPNAINEDIHTVIGEISEAVLSNEKAELEIEVVKEQNEPLQTVSEATIESKDGPLDKEIQSESISVPEIKADKEQNEQSQTDLVTLIESKEEPQSEGIPTPEIEVDKKQNEPTLTDSMTSIESKEGTQYIEMQSESISIPESEVGAEQNAPSLKDSIAIFESKEETNDKVEHAERNPIPQSETSKEQDNTPKLFSDNESSSVMENEQNESIQKILSWKYLHATTIGIVLFFFLLAIISFIRMRKRRYIEEKHLDDDGNNIIFQEVSTEGRDSASKVSSSEESDSSERPCQTETGNSGEGKNDNKAESSNVNDYAEVFFESTEHKNKMENLFDTMIGGKEIQETIDGEDTDSQIDECSPSITNTSDDLESVIEEDMNSSFAQEEEPSIEWTMQNENLSGSYSTVLEPNHSIKDGFVELTCNYESFTLEPCSTVDTSTQCIEKNIYEEQKAFKVTSESAPGIHFWAYETIDIGGYVLKAPCIYTVSDTSVFDTTDDLLEKNWAFDRFLNLSDIPDNLKFLPHDFEAVGQEDFSYGIGGFTLEQKAFYLNWLEQFCETMTFQTHCYTRYVDGLWYRNFVELGNLAECTVRWFQIAYYYSSGQNNIKELKRALASYYVAVMNGVVFSEEEKTVLAECFEQFFIQYHYYYKTNWDFDPVGFLSFLGHTKLPTSILLLETYGEYCDLWENQSDRSGQNILARAAVAYLLANEKEFVFRNADEEKTLECGRGPFRIAIKYYGGIEPVSPTKDHLLKLVKEFKTDNSIIMKSFYSDADFSWKEEYSGLTQQMPDSLRKEGEKSFQKIERLLSLSNPVLLDVLLSVDDVYSNDFYKKHAKDRKETIQKVKQMKKTIKDENRTPTVEELNNIYGISLGKKALKNAVDRRNAVLNKYGINVVVPELDDEKSLDEIKVIIQKV